MSNINQYTEHGWTWDWTKMCILNEDGHVVHYLANIGGILHHRFSDEYSWMQVNGHDRPVASFKRYLTEKEIEKILLED